MGFFSRGKSGGLMNVIRCDQQEYLVWKWVPAGQNANTTSRENSIRYGSSLRVKDGEMAIFVYRTENGVMQDEIVGPFDSTLKTANLPILANIVGTAFGGDSPFQAEIYFLNLAEVITLKFCITGFDVADPRFLDFTVPAAVDGAVSFRMGDHKNFIKKHRLQNFSITDFKRQVDDAIKRRVKQLVCDFPTLTGIPVVQIERCLSEINTLASPQIANDLKDYGVEMNRCDISAIRLNKNSEGWQELRRITANQQATTIDAQTRINIKNLQDTQNINARNMAESLRIQREEAQRAQRLQSEQTFIGAHAIDQQASVLRVGAESLGQMGNISMGTEGGATTGMNPAGMMTGMILGGAMGQQMAGMMNAMGQQIQSTMNTPPPVPQKTYYIVLNGQQAGPFDTPQLQQMVSNGQLTADTYVWKQGMSQWEYAQNVPEVANLLNGSTPPPIPQP